MFHYLNMQRKNAQFGFTRDIPLISFRKIEEIKKKQEKKLVNTITKSKVTNDAAEMFDLAKVFSLKLHNMQVNLKIELKLLYIKTYSFKYAAKTEDIYRLLNLLR